MFSIMKKTPFHKSQRACRVRECKNVRAPSWWALACSLEQSLVVKYKRMREKHFVASSQSENVQRKLRPKIKLRRNEGQLLTPTDPNSPLERGLPDTAS